VQPVLSVSGRTADGMDGRSNDSRQAAVNRNAHLS
jgi:hypothetical protein